MRVGIAQINTTVSDFGGNAGKIVSACAKLKDMGADFAVFPELALTGFNPKDMVFAESFLKANLDALGALGPRLALPALVGFVGESDGAVGRANCAAWIENGKVKKVCAKALFPNYDVFDEPRNYDAAKEIFIVEFQNKKIALTICEDIWTLPGVSTAARYNGFKPLDALREMNFESGKARAQKGVDLLVNISASVFSKTNDNVRGKGGMLCAVSDHVGAPLVWCNLVGGNDGVIFAGGSGVFAGASLSADGGAKSAVLKKFEEDFRVVDVDSLQACEGEGADYEGVGDLRRALVLGLRDFARKSGFEKVLLGLSGGLDSAVIAALAAEALGADNVEGVSLPSKISSTHSKDDARKLAENLGIRFQTVGIEKIVESAEASLSEAFRGLERCATEENIQSRARGLVLMALSNKFGAMLLTTGNKSECAVGYCTLYGDTCGALAPIADLYKTEVYALARHINREGEIIPQNTIDKPPSAELRENQTDQDSLPDYAVLDEILRLYIEERMDAAEISARGFDAETVKEIIRKTELSEYKRAQYAPVLKVSKTAFGAGRRMPLARKVL